MHNATLKNHFDIAVIGAGPAGSTIAFRLAELGYSVLLVEKETVEAKTHVGLSLTPGIHHWLNHLNLSEAVKQQSFERAFNSKVLWTTSAPILKSFGDEEAGYHVDRGQFDNLLVNKCRTQGVTVVQPGRITKLSDHKKEGWSFTLETESELYPIRCSFLVDAVGRNSIIKSKKIQDSNKLIAVYAYWSLASDKDHYSFIEAGDNHWYWAAPLSNGKGIACIFTDPSLVKEHDSVDSFYTKLIQKSTLLKPLFKDQLPDTILVCDATSQHDNEPVGENFIKVGDSAISIDPISSQGVQKAIKSGVQGATVVHTILQGKINIALEFYTNQVLEDSRKNLQWASEYYTEQSTYNSAFWQDRSIDISKNKVEPDTEIKLTQSDVLNLNKLGTFKTIPILDADEVTNREAFIIPDLNEPLVYLNSIHVTPLLKKMDGKTINECLQIVTNVHSKKQSLGFVKWMIFNRVLEPSIVNKSILTSH